MKRMVVILALVGTALPAQQSTRGIGVYPGDPKEFFGPALQPGGSAYRNLALHRPAFHSSSYDYNLTAQLVTDGIRETQPPRWVSTSTSEQGVLKKNEREWLLDGNWVTTVDLRGKRGWIQFELGGGERVPQVDRVDVDGAVQARQPDNQIWTCILSASDDGKSWRELGRTSGQGRPSGEIHPSIALKSPVRSRFFKLDFDTGRPVTWRIGEVAFFRGNAKQQMAGPYHFTSAWMAAGQGEEWVSVDLGVESSFDRVALHWIRRPEEAMIETSSDGLNWKALRRLTSTSLTDEIGLASPAQARYVRARMTRPATAEGYVLSEFEVFGRGGLAAQAHAAPAADASGQTQLSGGAWKVQRDSLVQGDGAALSKPGFRDDDWLIATVPGTILTSYLNAGAIPDPNFGDYQNMISDSFFYADFWYRNEFTSPAVAPGQHVWLDFKGVNWKAEVYFNGEKLGRVEGGFMRGRFDVTKLLRARQKNALAVRVEKNATPGSIKEKTFENPDKNGGVLGADNPTYHASIGWDWIPTIRGRDTGIWNSVLLSVSGPVTIENPFVTTTLPLPDTSRADVIVTVTLHNHGAQPVNGTIKGRFGDTAFDLPVALDGSSTKTVKLDPTTHAALRLQNPKLWWPAGYGDPNLYDVSLQFDIAGHASDQARFQAGVRQFRSSEEGGGLRLWINGRRFIPKGGNWGFPESMLRYRAREYDAAVRYHQDMHFNMIRNWVGQVGEDEFYESCDRHGIVIMQDFWLANPWDGPDPDDNALFMSNVRDTVLRIRNHPSVGLYCGRNEGYPPKTLDDGIRRTLAELHPGIHYIPSSADDVVSGHGPYQAMPHKYYFTQRATPQFHSEMGMPNIVTMESLRLMMEEKDMWPQGRLWGLHDFCLTGAQGGRSYIDRIQKSYGGASNINDWVSLAQFVNYEGYRAMFEAQSKNRMGLLIWMSHPTWPSFVWQTYDYFLEPTAAYFGSKKAAEPLHIQWNPATESVEVVNYSAGNATGLTAKVEVLNLDGSAQWEKSASLDLAEDSTAAPIKMEYPASVSPTHFLRLKLSRGAEAISENFYWRGTEEGDYQGLRTLPQVTIEAKTTARRDGGRWVLTTELVNTSKTPAMMVRLKAVREKSGDRILPVLYSDNYIALMPGERRTITTEVSDADTRGEAAAVDVDGFNVKPFRSSLTR